MSIPCLGVMYKHLMKEIPWVALFAHRQTVASGEGHRHLSLFMQKLPVITEEDLQYTAFICNPHKRARLRNLSFLLFFKGLLFFLKSGFAFSLHDVWLQFNLFPSRMTSCNASVNQSMLQKSKEGVLKLVTYFASSLPLALDTAIVSNMN